MKGRHQRGYKLYGEAKAQKKKTTFANMVITVCVVVALLVTGCVTWEYHRLKTVMPSSVISALFAFWGGELLIVALRQVFGSDLFKRGKSSSPVEAAGETLEQQEETIDDIFGGKI